MQNEGQSDCYVIHPPIEWDVPAHIQMAIETYDWNPIPDDGGLVESGTREQRTALYDWARTWRFERSGGRVEARISVQ